MSSSQEAYKQFLVRVTVPIASLVSLLLAALLVTILVVAWYQTDVARREQARLAEGAIKVRGEHIEKSALDYGAWDEAVANLVTAPNLEWADENIGKPTFQNLGFDMTFVIAPNDATTYGMIEGNRTERLFTEVLTSGFSELLAQQRAGSREGSTSGLIIANGRPAIAAVVPIRPLEPDPEQKNPQHLLIFIDAIDDVLLADLGHIYLLSNLRIESAEAAGAASISLLTANRSSVGALTWDETRPGNALLRTAVPVWGLLAFGFCFLTVLIFRQARSAAHMIGESERRATHDALTQLPNRVHLFEHLDKASRELARATDQSDFAVLYLDLDGFKAVNDVYGHNAGDQVLKRVAERIRQAVEPRDFVARLGGDEFVLVLPGRKKPQEIQAIGKTIIRAIEGPIDVDPATTVSVSATIGVTFAPADGVDPLFLLRNADQALYLGKRGGKGEVRFHMGLAERAVV
ncbi:diguanylate cyclase [Pararhizobium sp. A13]|uniref:sensor domain-containing diguanylate cyclase n=1 Tax=Pararhizobium sp. A13 TaxID=3133975 RepID=UPI00311ABD6C